MSTVDFVSTTITITTKQVIVSSTKESNLLFSSATAGELWAAPAIIPSDLSRTTAEISTARTTPEIPDEWATLAFVSSYLQDVDPKTKTISKWDEDFKQTVPSQMEKLALSPIMVSSQLEELAPSPIKIYS